MLGLQVQTPDFPLVGNTVPVAILFLIHIALAEFTLGALTLGVTAEWHAVRRGSARSLRYARGAVNTYYLLFSLSATMAVFAVVLLLGLWSTLIGTVANELLPLFGAAFGLFLVLTPLIVVYRNSFERIRPVRHAALGTVVLVLQTLFMVIIVGLDSYLIVPQHQGLFETALNPPYLPLLIHRFIGNISWAALFFAAAAAWKLRRPLDEDDQAFQMWAARVNLRVGLLFGLLMPLGGFALVEVLKSSQVGFFDNLVAGNSGSLMVAQECLVGATLIAGNVALAAEERRERGGWSIFAWGCIVFTTLAMALAAMPSAVLPDSINAARYVALGVAIVVTAAHLLSRMRPRARLEAGAAAVTLAGRRALWTAGAVALATSLLMGYIKEHARAPYTVYGELRQSDSHAQFTPPRELYP